MPSPVDDRLRVDKTCSPIRIWERLPCETYALAPPGRPKALAPSSEGEADRGAGSFRGGNLMSADTLSELLRAVRLRGAIC